MADLKDSPTSRGRWKSWLLVASLALNLFVIASVAGHFIGGDDRRGHWRSPDIAAGPFTGALTREDRRALWRAFREAAPDFRERRQEARDEFLRLADALRQTPWDREAALSVIAGHTARTADRLALGQRLIEERLAAMSDAERHALADRIEARLKRD